MPSPLPSSSSSSSSSYIASGNDIEVLPESATPIVNPAKPIPKRSRKKKNSALSSDSPTCGPPRKSSLFRGVTRHRWSGKYEAHLWDKSLWNSTRSKKGRQTYLGAYDSEEAAARTYDLAALKYWGPGPGITLNYPIEMYTKELEEMKNLSKEEFLASLRRQSSGFSRGVSKYRGVARHHHNGRWEARIGRVQGNKYMYLGTFNNEEEAAVAYDIAAIKQRGPKALTNFDMSNYADQLREIGEAQFGAQPMDGDNDARRRRGKAQRLTNEEGDRRLLHNNNDFSAEFMELKRYEVPIEADYASSTALNPTIIDEESFFNFWMDTAGEPFPTPSDIHMAEEAEEEKVERESYLLDFFKDGSNDNNLDFLMFEEPCRYPGEFGFGGDMEGRGEDGLEGFTNALPSPTTAAAPAGAAVGNGDETAGFDAALEFFDVPAGFDAASEYF